MRTRPLRHALTSPTIARQLQNWFVGARLRLCPDLLSPRELAERRDMLRRLTPQCPHCGSEQVQLIDHFTYPAEWRCRDCRRTFMIES